MFEVLKNKDCYFLNHVSFVALNSDVMATFLPRLQIPSKSFWS